MGRGFIRKLQFLESASLVEWVPNKLIGNVTQSHGGVPETFLALFMSTVLVLSLVSFPKDYPVFRCTNSKVTVQPSPYLSYRLPKDFVDLSTGEDVHKLIDFLKLVRSSRKNLWPSTFVRWKHQSPWNCAFVTNKEYIITEKAMYEAIAQCIVGLIVSEVMKSKLSYCSHFG